MNEKDRQTGRQAGRDGERDEDRLKLSNTTLSALSKWIKANDDTLVGLLLLMLLLIVPSVVVDDADTLSLFTYSYADRRIWVDKFTSFSNSLSNIAEAKKSVKIRLFNGCWVFLC